MGARDRTSCGPAGLEAREFFEAYAASRRQVERAARLLQDARTAAEAGGGDPALLAGVDLATRRLTRDAAHKDAALAHLTASLPAQEAPWFLPDD